MNPSRLAIAIIGFLFISASTLLVAGDEHSEKVINIELAMRAVQERFLKARGDTSPIPIWWEPNKDLITPGPMPPDGFYCEDLLDREFAARRVDDLFWNLMGLHVYIDKSRSTLEERVSIVRRLGEIYPGEGITAENHDTVFEQLVGVINAMETIHSSFQTPSFDDVYQAYGNSLYSDAGEGELTCSDERYWAADEWEKNDSLGALNISQRRARVYPMYRQRQLDSDGGGSATIFSVEGAYTLIGRHQGTARIYIGMRETVVGLDGYFNTLQSYSANNVLWSETAWVQPLALVGTVRADESWTSPVFGPTSDEATSFGFGCGDFGLAKTIRRDVTWESVVHIDLAITTYIDEEDVYRDADACSECESCSVCVPGALAVENACIKIGISLGGGESESAGSLSIYSLQPSESLCRPEGLIPRLQPSARPFFETIDGVRALRQIIAPQAIVNVVTLDPFSYQLRFYYRSAVAGTAVDGSVEVSGEPYKTITIENLDSVVGPVERLGITSESDGSIIESHVFVWLGGSDWDLISEVGELSSSIQRNVETVGNRKIETIEKRDENGNLKFREALTYEIFPWNLGEDARQPSEIVRKEVGWGGDIESTEYFYWESQDDAQNYGRLRLRVDPDGFWERFEYDLSGRVRKTISPFLNAPPDSEINVRVVEENRYEDASYEEVVESIILDSSSYETSRRYRMFDWNRIREIQATEIGVNPDEPSNIVSIEAYHSYGEGEGELKSRTGPDGNGVLYAYDRINGMLVKTIDQGLFNEGRSSIVDGTRTVQTLSSSGIVVSETVSDIATGLEIEAWVASELGPLGRVLRMDYTDGTYVQRQYGCCGLEYEVDREGVRTDYAYDGDLLKSTTTSGLTIRYEYDALGRQIRATRVGSDVTEIQLSETEYDALGKVVAQTEYGTRRTTFSETMQEGGGKQTTTTYADGGTRIETFARDGSLLSVRGTAVAPADYEYGADELGSFVVEIRPEGELSSEWIKTWYNLLGNVARVAYPDGGFEEYGYDSLGRLNRHTDADGVVTLYGYDERGRRSVVAIDMDRDGVIDYDGLDRITKTTNSFSLRDDIPVNRTEVSRWETENLDEATVVLVREVSFDGRWQWEEQFGVASQIETSYPEPAKRVVKSHSADGTSVEQSYSSGRLIETRSLDADGGVEATVAFAYDAHGRLEEETVAGVGATSYTYSNEGQVLAVISPDPDPENEGEGLDRQTTRFSYDLMGRVETVIDDAGNEAWRSYWPTGQLKRSWGGQAYPVEYAYTEQGRPASLTTWKDFNNETGAATTRWSYDPQRGWLLGKSFEDGSAPSYEYSAAGRLSKRTWARGVETVYQYDVAGQLGSVSYSDGSTVGSEFQYDRLGRVSSVNDGVGTRSYFYESDRLVSETVESGGLAGWEVSRQLDELARVQSLELLFGDETRYLVGYGYNPATGRLDAISYKDVTHSYRYDGLTGRVVGYDTALAGGSMLSRTNSLDRTGRLTRVESASSFGSVSRSYAYDRLGRRSVQSREDGKQWRYGYDVLGQVDSAVLADEVGEPVAGYGFGYSYDDIGNRVESTENGMATAYGTDVLNRMVSRASPSSVAVRGEASTVATVTVNGQLAQRDGESFHADVPADNAAGPQWLEIEVTGVVPGAGEGGADAVAEWSGSVYAPPASEDYDYDADGNLLSDGRWRYDWDAENRLISMETLPAAYSSGLPRRRLEFDYDYQGRRYSKSTYAWDAESSIYDLQSSIRYLYDGWNLVAELREDSDPGISDFTTHVWGLDISETMQGAGGVGGLLVSDLGAGIYAPSYDGNGNVVGLVDLSSGVLAASLEYGPFGEVLEKSYASEWHRERLAGFAFGFSTKYEDSESGLLYYGYRYYEPELGRWLSRDPIGEQGGLNLYGMVGNDPVGKFDVLGLATNKEIFKGLLGLEAECKKRYPLLAYHIEKVVIDWIESDSNLNAAFRAVQGSIKKVKGAFGKAGLSGTSNTLQMLESLSDIRIVGDALKGIDDELKFGDKVIGNAGKFVYILDSSTSSKSGALNVVLAVSSSAEAFGGKALGPFGKYFTTAIKGIDEALTSTGRNVAAYNMNTLKTYCNCDSGEIDYIGNKALFEGYINGIRGALRIEKVKF